MSINAMQGLRNASVLTLLFLLCACTTAEKQEENAIGITAADVTPELAARYSLESKKGVLVTRIDPDGPASEANLRVGDLILEADGQEVDSVKSFKAILGALQEGKVLRLLVQRKSTLLYTTVKLN